MNNELLRELPAVHQLMQSPDILEIGLEAQLSKEILTDYVRQAVRNVREQILSGTQIEKISLQERIVGELKNILLLEGESKIKKVINGTGVVLHTNLGRARLSENAIERIAETASSYSNLEFNLETGARGSRHDLIEDLLLKVTGAEAVMVVNNNAAAVFLILRTLAKEKEVIVSRGELVEIGGSFRVSSIMEESGAKLVEVGTTNKTHLKDYEAAISEETTMLMKVHTSNFRIEGFTSAVPAAELVKLREKHSQLIVYEDLGSGALFDFSHYGIGDEPVASKSIASKIDLISFSGDKLLGGPQAGIIAGRKRLIDRLKKHQMARVLRVDKMTLAGLEATLQAYVRKCAEKEIPVVRDMLKSESEMKRQAEHFMNSLSEGYKKELTHVQSAAGGGTLPGVYMRSIAVAVEHPSLSAEELRLLLRQMDTPITATIKMDRTVIDFRTIAEEDMEALIHGFNHILYER
ncbi:L-seryl-tRNA(Sec) selenium transferase [Aciduricibacillus chroicocephali]|uniref:L-seryl-tRNA(Sec) selenium transferase n=1 Tax=Aciduricibacillus chroicocephali TaxID=3054939 RepID=A0ABY9KW47_9BACI|nr:L-seryl-tRNA(Sec) selenium transferase [Bacillaceae bacterium 44XB]